MKQAERIARRRQRVRDLRGQDWSLQRIADDLGVTKPTVLRDLQAVPETGPPAPPAGNGRALTHGATSEQRLEPLRREWEATVLERWPWLDDIRTQVLADRLARLASARRWLDLQGGVVRGADGKPWPIAVRLEAWASRVESVIAELDREGRMRGMGDPLEKLRVDLSVLSVEERRQLWVLLEKAKNTIDGDALASDSEAGT